MLVTVLLALGARSAGWRPGAGQACRRGQGQLDRSILPPAQPRVPGKDRRDLQGIDPGLDAGPAAVRPGRRTERPAHRPRRRRLRPARLLRRADRDAEPRQAGGRRPAVQQLPHDGALLAVARRPADRPQPPRHRPGGDHRGGHRVPGQLRLDPEERRHRRRDAQAERLQHDGARQVAPRAVHRVHLRRAVRPLAARHGVREVLRLPRRRDRPVGAAAGAGQPLHRHAHASPATT